MLTFQTAGPSSAPLIPLRQRHDLYRRTHNSCSRDVERTIDELPRNWFHWRLGDDAKDGLGVAGADLDPAVGPVEAEAVPFGGGGIGKRAAQRGAGGGDLLAGTGEFVLDDGVA